ncbi:MAG: methionyl-tRNA formyltransferase [Patescibacteria group bacterium]|nr:methionyl-tRNA formyltransferase [Patescibacteria group bacterium]MCL5093611.1 methionyl-tRNA formyltransferase [Patescibacteria group bacterium]
MKQSPKYKIVYAGTPEIAVLPLESLARAGFNITGVFTRPDREKGRGKKKEESPVKLTAKKLGLAVYQPENKEELTRLVAKLKPDLGVVFVYGMILPKEALELPKHGFINIHPSLLPKYRGPSPILTPILNGDSETGVTIMKVTEEMDAGPILAQEEIRIESDENALELSQKLSEKSAEMSLKSLPLYLEGKLKEKEQDPSKATYTKLTTKDDGKIDWQERAETIERKTRAYFPWPGSYTLWEGKILKIIEAKTSPLDISKTPGEVKIRDLRLLIQTGKGSLEILKLQLEGKKATRAEDFIKGYPKIAVSILK